MVATVSRPNTQVANETPGFERLSARRRRRPGWVLAGIALVILSMLAGILLFIVTSTTEPMLAVREDLEVGHIMTEADLVVVDVIPSQSINSIPLDQKSSVLGRATTAPLPKGLLLSPDLFTDSGLIEEGKVLAAFSPNRIPRIQVGDLVRLHSNVEAEVEGETVRGAVFLGEGRVWSLPREGSTGDPIVTVVIDSEIEAPLVLAASNDDVGLTLVSQG